MQKLIIINGHPASGKTSIASALAEQTGYVLISRDELKERLYDEQLNDRPADLTDLEWSQQLGGQSFDLLFEMIPPLLDKGESLVIESPFKRDTHSIVFQKIIDEYQLDAFQLMLTCDASELRRRFVERYESGERHPAHPDSEHAHRFEAGGDFAIHREPLELSGKTMTLDTTNFEAVDVHSILDFLES